MQREVIIIYLLMLLTLSLTLAFNMNIHDSKLQYKKRVSFLSVENKFEGISLSSDDWIISNITIVDNISLIIDRSILIQSGGALILRNCVLYMSLSSDGEHGIDVYNGGNLTVIGSKITAYDVTKNYFIRVYAGAKLRIENSEISYAGFGTGYDMSGIWINTGNAIIKNSKIHHNRVGITLYNAYNCIIYGNNISYNKYDGIYIINSDNNLIYENIISSNNAHLEGEHRGIYMSSSSNNSIYGNYISNHKSSNTFAHGLLIYKSTRNYIYGNIISSNKRGLEFSYAKYNRVYGNNFTNNNEIGVIFHASTNNTLFLNNFIGSYLGGEDLHNFLDNNRYGNYWDDYPSSDLDDDMIGDNPRRFKTSQVDKYPLMYPVKVYSWDIYYLKSHVYSDNKSQLKIKVTPAILGKALAVQLNYTLNGTLIYENMTYNTITDTFNWCLDLWGQEWYLNNTTILFDYAPKIKKIIQIPEEPTSMQSVTINVYMVDDHKVTRAILSYRPEFTPTWTNITMSYNANNNSWVAIVPSIHTSATVYYRIYVYDNAGNYVVSEVYSYTITNLPSGSPLEDFLVLLFSLPLNLIILVAGVGGGIGFTMIKLLKKSPRKRM